jgi:hypothetical protein
VAKSGGQSRTAPPGIEDSSVGTSRAEHGRRENKQMLFTIAVILLVLWLLGFATEVAGSLIHIVLVVALILFVLGLFSGRRTAI